MCPGFIKLEKFFNLEKKYKDFGFKTEKILNLGPSIYSINPADPVSLQPEPEPEPDWKEVARLAGTGFPVAHWIQHNRKQDN